MRRIYVGLVLWQVLIWAAACVLGVLPGEPLGPRGHALLGLFAAFFACLVPSVLIAHFIGSMKWMQQTGRGAGIPDADTKALRTAWVKGGMFPWLVGATLLAVATGVTGRFVEGSSLGAWTHAVLAVLAIPVAAAGLVLAVRGLDANRARMRGIAERARALHESNQVREQPPEELLPESGRAGGKVFLFLSLQAWFLWVYVRFVLRNAGEPLWPYAAASVLLFLLGLAMLRSARVRPQRPPSPS